jgi:hypothetical protein
MAEHIAIKVEKGKSVEETAEWLALVASSVLDELVRRRMIWDRERYELAEDLAHLLG